MDTACPILSIRDLQPPKLALASTTDQRTTLFAVLDRGYSPWWTVPISVSKGPVTDT